MNLAQEQAFYIKLGNNIRDHRLKAGISQEVLGDQLSLTRSSIVNIEKGRQRPLTHTLVEIAQTLRVPLLELLPSTEIKELTSGKVVAASANLNIIGGHNQVDKNTEAAVKQFVSFIKKDQ
ncbi:MAG: helix-turn-helix transcriptional regulator [Sphingobacteriales bacterium]|nr:helix-turn-helix transcriptional regulator [Sphingobacteriales bacterium]OJY89315.1 MAG: hypothetical protein BGP14_05265 [Sphingobacteriales bacterium 44-15]